MLPFPMLKAQADEIELTDDDLSFEEESVEASSVDVEYDVDLDALVSSVAVPTVSNSLRRTKKVENSEKAPRPRKTSAVSLLASSLVTRDLPRDARRGLPPPLESDVADCLASIAAEASRIPPAVTPMAAPAPLPLPSPASPASAKSFSRLPAIAPPPFPSSVRGPSASPFQKRPAQLVDDRDEIVEQAATLPRAVRSPYLDQLTPRPSVFSRPSFAPPTPSQSIKPSAPAASSVAPVALSLPREASPTVVVPAAAPSRFWLAGVSAVLGAAAAFAAVRFVPSAPSSMPVVAATVAAAPPPAQPVQAPKVARTATSMPAPAPVAVLKFDESEAVDITVPAPVSSAGGGAEAASVAPVVVPVAHAAKPRRAPRRPATTAEPTLGGRLETPAAPVTTSATPSATVAAAVPPAPAPAPTARKRLTPEQELAEAQLKASMR